MFSANLALATLTLASSILSSAVLGFVLWMMGLDNLKGSSVGPGEPAWGARGAGLDPAHTHQE